jgi:hypothetical protein
MTTGPQRHDNSLADVIWWLKGFAAAAEGEAGIEARQMHKQLNSVRDWHSHLSRGTLRMIGLDEETRAVAITERELEQIHDALGGKQSAEQVAAASALTNKILGDLCREARTEFDEIPF